jgi:transcriptional regulator with XRE-family HTH domain
MTINERLVELRKSLKIKQSEFAQKIGMKQSTLSTLELGNNPVSDRYIKLICLSFGVSEEWLRTGNGNMFKPENFPRYDELLEIFKSLSDERQMLFLDLERTLLSSQKTKNLADPSVMRHFKMQPKSFGQDI